MFIPLIFFGGVGGGQEREREMCVCVWEVGSGNAYVL